MARLPARLEHPEREQPDRDGRERDQRPAPAARQRRERYGERGRERRTDVDAGRVDARREGRAIGKPLLDRDRHDRTGEADPHAERKREQDEQDGSRGSGPREPEEADEREAERDREPRPGATGQVGRRRREGSHAEHRDRPEQPRGRVRHVEVVLDLREQRADAHDLGAERNGPEKEREQETGAATGHGR